MYRARAWVSMCLGIDVLGPRGRSTPTSTRWVFSVAYRGEKYKQSERKASVIWEWLGIYVP